VAQCLSTYVGRRELPSRPLWRSRTVQRCSSSVDRWSLSLGRRSRRRAVPRCGSARSDQTRSESSRRRGGVPAAAAASTSSSGWTRPSHLQLTQQPACGVASTRPWYWRTFIVKPGPHQQQCRSNVRLWRNINVVFGSVPLTPLCQTWRHQQNRKYTTYCTVVRGGPNYGHRQHV